jgi:hypothetical protein
LFTGFYLFSALKTQYLKSKEFLLFCTIHVNCTVQ